jgi:hypothetical protein
MLRKRAPTRSVRKTDLHPLDRCDEGMKGRLTRPDMGVKIAKGIVENTCSIWNELGEATSTSVPAHLLTNKLTK